MQILDQTLSRMKYSTQSRILAELALVRICNLEDLEELSNLIVQLQANQPVAVRGRERSGHGARSIIVGSPSFIQFADVSAGFPAARCKKKV